MERQKMESEKADLQFCHLLLMLLFYEGPIDSFRSVQTPGQHHHHGKGPWLLCKELRGAKKDPQWTSADPSLA